jgi:hypothetical protein
MGYDMTTVVIDEGEKERVAEALERFNDAVKVRGAFNRGTDDYKAAQAEVDRRMNDLTAEEHSYFRLNVWGMSAAREAMWKLGMLDDAFEYGEFPDAEDFGVTSEMYDFDDDDPATPEPMRRYREAQNKVLGAMATPVVGIPVFKLGSNDGWIVTPEELRVALAEYDAATLDDLAHIPDGDWWPKWIEYLRYAQERGGFRVN